MRLVSSASAIALDCGSTCGEAPLSKMVTRLPSPWWRASCCQAKRAPWPSAKSLFLPPSRHTTLAVLRRDLVDGPGVARRDEQVAVGVDVDRVDVEVVEEVADAGVGLGRRHVVEAAPLEQHLRARNLELLDDPLDDLLRAAALAGLREVDGAQIPGGHERRPVGREEELVQVGRLPAAGREPCDLAVGLVEDHVVAVAEPVLGLPLPPGQHRLALVERGLEVRGRLVRGRVEPHRLPVVVEDQHAALAGARRRRDEDAARGSARRRVEDGHLRRLQVRPRHEVMRVACASSARPRALERPGRALAAAREKEPGAGRQCSREQPAAADRAVCVFLVQPSHGTVPAWCCPTKYGAWLQRAVNAWEVR